jgi:very-short-patch-repair endonuclease
MEGSMDCRIAEIARRQYGVFTLDQSDEIGFTPDQREFRARAGRWEVRFDRVYSMAGVPRSWHGDLLAACFGAQGLVVASHRSAGKLWDLPGGSSELIEITCHRWKRAKIQGLVVHETLLLADDDICLVEGIPTASIEQTLLGLAAVVHVSIVEMAIDRALHRKLTTVVALEQFVQRKGERGRNGVGVLRAVLNDLDPLAGVPESAMETKLKRLLRRHELPTPEFQYEIWHNGRFVARVDAAYPEHQIAIEYDSYAHHTGKQAIVRDNDRRNELREIKWRVVVFTAADVARDGGRALQALRTELGSGAVIP